jgi:hypothetical protein
MVSIGYLIIFLLMQPTSYAHLKALLLCQDYTNIQKEEQLVYRKTGSMHSSAVTNSRATMDQQQQPSQSQQYPPQQVQTHQQEKQTVRTEGLQDSHFARVSADRHIELVEKNAGNVDGIDVELMSHASMYFRESSTVLRDTRNEEDLFHVIEQEQMFFQQPSEADSSAYGSSNRDTLARDTFARSSAGDGTVFNSMHNRPDSLMMSSIVEIPNLNDFSK